MHRPSREECIRSNLRIFLISGASSPSLLEEEERLMMERVVGEGGLVISRVEGDEVGEYQAVAGVSIQSSSMAVPHTMTGPQNSENKQRNALEGQRPAGRHTLTPLGTSHPSLPSPDGGDRDDLENDSNKGAGSNICVRIIRLDTVGNYSRQLSRSRLVRS